MMALRAFAALSLMAITASGAKAHEFWIDPLAPRVAPGAEIVADLRVGDDFSGSTLPYMPGRILSLTLSDEDGHRQYRGRLGDMPAFRAAAPSPGLKVIAYTSHPTRLDYDDWTTFLDYTDREGLEDAVTEHLADGLPRTGFTENFSRCAKALVQVGPVRETDSDIALGLPLELIASANPFREGLENLTVTLLWQGEPAAGLLLSVFRKTGEGVAPRETLRTDEQGQATVALTPGARHLLSAVRIERAPGGSEAVWESHWASLTFGP